MNKQEKNIVDILTFDEIEDIVDIFIDKVYHTDKTVTLITNKINGATKKDIGVVIDALTDVIKEAVLAGDTVTIPEICKISSKDVAERSGVTKLGDVEKAWTKPAHKEATVKVLKSFKNIFEA